MILGTLYKKERLGEVFQFIRNGANISQGNPGGIPITRIETIADGKLDLTRLGYAGIIELGRYEDYVLVDGDILMSHINSETHLGKVAFVENLQETIIHGMNLLCLRAKSSVLYPKYAYYYFKSPFFRNQLFRITKKSVNQASFSVSDLKRLGFILPPLETQRRIADILDKAQKLIDKRKQQIELLDEFLQSAFIDIFLANSHSEKIRLSDLCTINPAKSEIRNLDDSMLVSFIPMASVSEDGEIIDQETRVMREVKRGYTYFREGDVLFAKITPCMENGKSAVATGLINQIGFGSTEFHVLRPNKNISGTWLHQLIRLGSFRIAAEKSMTGSAGQKRVPRDFLDRYMVSVPPVELQAFFDELANKVKTQKALMKKSITELEHCFDSIMQKAFRGELFG